MTDVLLCLSQLRRRDLVHIVEGLVLAAHGPDEGVIAGARAGMDGPGRGDDRLLVLHHDMAGLLAFAHHVEDDLVFGHFEVEVDLHAALMRVRGHGVPDRTGLQHGHAHRELAGL